MSPGRHLSAFTPILALLGGCSWMGPTATDTVGQLVPVGDARSVRVEGFNGSITVVGGSDGDTREQVAVRADRRAKGSDLATAEANLERLEIIVREEGDRVVVTTDRPDGFRGGVDFSVVVPDGWAVDATTSNGSIRCEGVRKATAKSSNGKLTFVAIAEAIDGQTSNGRIEVETESAVSTRLRTSNGSVRFRGGLQSGRNEIRTSNGSIDVTVVGGPVAVAATTSNGRIRIGDREGKKELTTAIGSGRGEGIGLQLKTSNGSVRVQTSDASISPSGAEGPTDVEGFPRSKTTGETETKPTLRI